MNNGSITAMNQITLHLGSCKIGTAFTVENAITLEFSLGLMRFPDLILLSVA